MATQNQPAPNRPPQAGARGSALPWAVTGLTLLATVIAMRFEGRVWWCEQGDWWPWIGDVWTPHCSQHLLDPYSITHASHGLIFYWALWPLRGKLSLPWRFCIAIAIAAVWEVVENSAFIVDRYRQATMSLDYLGDSVVNSLGDILSCAAGFFIARALGLLWTIVLFAVTEVGLLLLIRDNLTLNVIMLISPVEAIKEWQSEGHQPTVVAPVAAQVSASSVEGEMPGTTDSSRRIMANFLGIAKTWGGYNEHGQPLPPPQPLVSDD